MSLARPVLSLTFSSSTRLTSSLAPLLAKSPVGAVKETPMMVAPGVSGARVASGTKPMNSICELMSLTMALADIGGSMSS